MSSPSLRGPLDERPLARETAAAAASVGAFALWFYVVAAVVNAVRPASAFLGLVDGGPAALAVTASVNGAVLVAGMLAFTGAYVALRGVPVPVGLPERDDAPAFAAAVVGPLGLVALVHAAATLTGSSIAAVSATAYAPDSVLGVSALVVALGLLLTLPSALLVTHVLVQGSLRRAVDGPAVVALTTLLVGLSGPFDVTRVQLTVLVPATVLLAAAVALPAVAASAFDRRWLTAVGAVPLAMLAGFALVDWATTLGGGVAALFALSEVAVVAIGASSYERSDSLLAPALAYATFAVAVEAAAFVAAAGLPI